MDCNRIDTTESIDTNKTDGSCECIICHHWYFLAKHFRFQPKVYNGCHDMIQKSMSFNDIAIVTAKRNYYTINFCFMTKNEAVDRMKNADLSGKSGKIWL